MLLHALCKKEPEPCTYVITPCRSDHPSSDLLCTVTAAKAYGLNLGKGLLAPCSTHTPTLQKSTAASHWPSLQSRGLRTCAALSPHQTQEWRARCVAPALLSHSCGCAHGPWCRLRCTGTGYARSCACCATTSTGLHWSCGNAPPRCVCVHARSWERLDLYV